MSGANGSLRWSSTVSSSTTVTDSSWAISLARFDPGRFLWRSRLYLTASASIGVPSWNTTSSRRSIVTVRPSSDTV